MPAVCDPRGLPGTFIAPRLVVEVLSPGTEGHDRNRKWPLYQSIAALTDVLLVEQATRRVQHHRRVGPNEWLVRFVTAGEVALESLELSLPIDEIYSGVDELPG
ncbi:MAG: Uma2 family endonuclease [bacterium]